MKKLIQLCSFLSLVIVFSVVSAQAQTVRQFAADIPFNFNVGEKTFDAGSYIIKVSKYSQNSVALTLENKKSKKLQSLIVRGNGDAAKAEPTLFFTFHDSRRFLTKFSMSGMGLTLPVSNEARESVKSQNSPEAKSE